MRGVRVDSYPTCRLECHSGLAGYWYTPGLSCLVQQNIVSLKLHRADVVEKGVASNAIIEHLNILEDFTGRLSSCMEQGLVNEFDFQGREEALGDGVDAPSNCPCDSCCT
ncbi:MAG: hypothetical protein ACI9W2_002742 [Gammaproteobacteria bacterium]|jgi:hypothetical protein